MNNHALDIFYFISGFTRMYTGYEVETMVKRNRISWEATCQVTGGVEMMLVMSPACRKPENNYVHGMISSVFECSRVPAYMLTNLSNKQLRGVYNSFRKLYKLDDIH